MSPCHGYMGLKTVRPRKRQLAKPRVRTKASKPQPRVIEHVRYGEGKLVAVRLLDSGDYAALVRFSDGGERVIQLEQRYWVSDVRDFIPAPPKKAKASKSVAVEDGSEADDAGIGRDETDLLEAA